MIDCMKKYKMVLTDDDGNVYKSDNVDISGSRGYNIEKDGCMTADMHLIAWGFRRESVAGTPPEMPTAEVAATASKIIQEEKYKAAIKEQWISLTEMVCKAIKKGESYIHVNSLWMENEKRLIEMGYEVSRVDLSHEWIIRWAKPFYLS